MPKVLFVNDPSDDDFVSGISSDLRLELGGTVEVVKIPEFEINRVPSQEVRAALASADLVAIVLSKDYYRSRPISIFLETINFNFDDVPNDIAVILKDSFQNSWTSTKFLRSLPIMRKRGGNSLNGPGSLCLGLVSDWPLSSFCLHLP